MKFPLLALLATLALVLSHSVEAHPNGTSKIQIRLLESDSLTVEVDANTGDVISALRSDIVQGQTDTAQARAYQNQVGNYMYSRIQVQADGRPVLSPVVQIWKRGGKGPADDLASDTASLWDTVHVITFGGRLPAGARALRVNAALFPEFGIQSICEISVFWKDTLIQRKWVGLDKTFFVELARDSLDAALARTRGAPEELGGARLFGRFLGLGYVHILPYGLDHILFVLGLFFFSTRIRPLLAQVTAFTVAHSITLGLALVGVFTLSARIVEPLIALSIAIVGLENVFFRKVRASRWLIVFTFGLVHGMGFAGVLSQFGLPEGGFWPALTGFNIGVELGQLTVISLAFGLTVWFRKKPWYFQRVVVPVSLAISAVGLFWAVQRALGF